VSRCHLELSIDNKGPCDSIVVLERYKAGWVGRTR